MSRRDFVKATSLGTLGVGLIGSALTGWSLRSEAEAHNQEGRGRGRGRGRDKKKEEDTLLRVLSWTLTALPEESEILECEFHSFEDEDGHSHDLLHIHHRVVAEIQHNPNCDEVFNDLFSADLLKLDLETSLRLNGPAGTPIGTHRGEFQLIASDGKLLASGDVEGTDGLEADEDHTNSNPCAAAGHGEGLLRGQLLLRQGPKAIQNAEIRAAFSSQIDPLNLTPDLCQNPEDSPWKGWTANLDGVIVGRHERKKEREREREREHEREHERGGEARGGGPGHPKMEI
ncbi:MAG: twin-arginine translocation signal domain-containing protein [Candidatus Tectomicrobia bacterium]|uniref:Twin-arginine translocation signal domain-containing protein n=1 Tax=Tectimicrobiota bacterium TaxID=2528274 RepID=A0A932CMK9_UNCTE|nr:twin-arginine translocation signal domain-containing protein [Candidatus Tectomicrobia bacterium]